MVVSTEAIITKSCAVDSFSPARMQPTTEAQISSNILFLKSLFSYSLGIKKHFTNSSSNNIFQYAVAISLPLCLLLEGCIQ